MRVRRDQLLLPLPARDFIQSGSELFVFFIRSFVGISGRSCNSAGSSTRLPPHLLFHAGRFDPVFLQTCDGRHFTNRKI